MLTIVICKLYEWEQANLVVLLVIDENPLVGFQSLILLLYLSICLQVEYSTQTSLLFDNFTDLCPHPIGEDQASV
jgi:hypothetical protein